MKLPGISYENLQKHTPENNGHIEPVHYSNKTDHIWPNEFIDFHDDSIVIGETFSDYDEFRPHSSIDYLPPREFRRKFLDDPAFGVRFEKKEVELTLDEN